MRCSCDPLKGAVQAATLPFLKSTLPQPEAPPEGLLKRDQVHLGVLRGVHGIVWESMAPWRVTCARSCRSGRRSAWRSWRSCRWHSSRQSAGPRRGERSLLVRRLSGLKGSKVARKPKRTTPSLHHTQLGVPSFHGTTPTPPQEWLAFRLASLSELPKKEPNSKRQNSLKSMGTRLETA